MCIHLTKERKMKKIALPIIAIILGIGTLAGLIVLTIRELLKEFDDEMEEIVATDYPGDEDEDW